MSLFLCKDLCDKLIEKRQVILQSPIRSLFVDTEKTTWEIAFFQSIKAKLEEKINHNDYENLEQLAEEIHKERVEESITDDMLNVIVWDLKQIGRMKKIMQSIDKVDETGISAANKKHIILILTSLIQLGFKKPPSLWEKIFSNRENNDIEKLELLTKMDETFIKAINVLPDMIAFEEKINEILLINIENHQNNLINVNEAQFFRHNISNISSAIKHNLSIPHLEILEKYNENKLMDYDQSTDYRLGLKGGYCYGFVVQKARSSIDLDADRLQPVLDQLTHDIQDSQPDREKNQGHTKIKRISKTIYAYKPEHHADELIKQLMTHRNKHLTISIHSDIGRHAVYVKYNVNGQIDFMDPNKGSYQFQTIEQFHDFYKDLIQTYHNNRIIYHSFSVKELRPDQNVEESKNIMGVFHSYLYGAKYKETDMISSLATRITYGFLGFVLGAAIGTMYLPGLGSIIGGVVLGLASQFIVSAAFNTGFRGVMGVVDYLRFQVDTMISSCRSRSLSPKNQMELSEQSLAESDASNSQGNNTTYSQLFEEIGPPGSSSDEEEALDESQGLEIEIETEPLVKMQAEPENHPVYGTFSLSRA